MRSALTVLSVVVCALLLAATGWMSAAAGEPETVTIVLRADAWCPFNCDPESDKPGYMIEIAREVFGRHGIAVDYQLMPWARVLEEVKAGRIDGAIGASIHPGRGFVFGANPLGEAGLVMAARADYPFSYTGPASLDGHRLGVVREYSYDSGPLDAYIALHAARMDKVVLVSDEDVSDRLIRMLLTKRVDVIVESGPVLMWQAARMGMPGRLRIVGRLPADPISIGFTPAKPDSQRLANLLSDGMAEMRASGRLAEILARYGLTDFAVPVPAAKPKPRD